MPPLRVAITGVAGRLGAAISKALKKDARVEVVAGLDVIAGKEVTQTADLAAGGFRLPGCDVVVHAAALPGPSRTPPPGVDATLGERFNELIHLTLKYEEKLEQKKRQKRDSDPPAEGGTKRPRSAAGE